MRMLKSTVGHYVAAVTGTAVALAFGQFLNPLVRTTGTYLALYLAIVCSAWFCGLAPSILGVLLGAAGVWLLCLAPQNFILLPSRASLFGFFGFLLVSNRTSLLKEDSPQVVDQRKTLLRRQGSWEGELIHTRRDGTLVYVASRWTLQQETEHEPVIWLEINRDITERKKAEQELQKAEEERKTARELAFKELENQVRERTAELEQSNKQLRQLSASLIHSQDDERRRIARDLHDSAGQYLGAVSIALDVVKQEQDSTSRKLAEAAELAKACTTEIRTLSHLLHPPLLEELGFASAAQWYIDGFSARSGIQVQAEIPKQLERLGNDVELVLFRILQESLTNVHRHSGSKTASIRVGADSQQAWLEVQDQGNGSSSGFRPGIGITGMRERVKDLAGTLEISSDPSGTRVRAVLPLSLKH